MNKILKVRCPNCSIRFDYYETEYRPFCSERCKMIDLGHWFKESYRVPENEKYKTDPNNENENENENENDETENQNENQNETQDESKIQDLYDDEDNENNY